MDIALGPFGLTAERAIVAEFATPLFSDASLLFAALGRPEVNPWGFLLPFSHSLWAATMGALGLGVVAATVMVVAGTRRSLWVAPHCWWRVIFDLIFVSCGVLCQQSNSVTTYRTFYTEGIVICGIIFLFSISVLLKHGPLKYGSLPSTESRDATHWVAVFLQIDN